MKKGVVVIILLFFLLAISIAFSANHNNSENNNKVDKEVEDKLKQQDEVSVIVVLVDDYDVLDDYYSASELNNADDFDKKKMMVEKLQEKVLSELDYVNIKQNDSKTNVISEISDIGNALNKIEFELKNKFITINGFSGNVTKEGLEKLKNNPYVKRIDINYPNSISLGDTVSIVNATKTWKIIQNDFNITGKGETICVIDSGIDYTHPDLGNCTTDEFIAGNCSKVIGGYDIKNNDNNPIDDNGHGTNVAGIIAANGSIVGIAPDAKLVAIKTQGSDGTGNQDDLISGIEWCTNNASKFNISVISMSLGCTTATYAVHCDSQPFCNNQELSTAIGAAIKKNISVIASSGNDGSKTFISSPACIANVTAVGSTDKDNAISSFSSRNAITDLFAPGKSITTTAKDGGSISPSGTSFSVPHVSAAFALIRQFKILESNLILTPIQIQNALNITGKILNDSGGTGLLFSRINIFGAIFHLDISPQITFVLPTPTNQSNIANSSFFVNITSNKELLGVVIEFNQTNQTMNGSGTNWYKNITGLDSGVYFYKVWGNDSVGKSNVSELRVVQINNTQPNIIEFFPNSTIAGIVEPNNQTFNITINNSDADILIISWYRNGTLVSDSDEFNFTGNFSTFGFYNITVEISDGFLNDSKQWNFTVNNTNRAPSAVNITINSTDFLNRTNGTINVFWSFSDSDEDIFNTWQDNETKWYNNNVEDTQLRNLTTISFTNTTKNEIWNFSVRVFDGTNFSNFVNASITINNAAPEINITVDSITVNASDIDNDALTFKINDSSRFTLTNGIYFIWNTELTDSGTYKVNITVNDTEAIDSKIVTINVLDARDLDNDGNPDFNDTDDDNDGILDENDFLTGNLSSINTTLTINITINGTTNLSKLFNGTFPVIIKTNLTTNSSNATLTLITFEYKFNATNILDFGKITINYSIKGFSGISLRGFTRPSSNFTKNFTIDKVNTTVKAVCIKDADVSFESISSSCNSDNEILIDCNNITNKGYTCFDTGTRYKITGLNHSAVKELCVDNDGDGWGDGCANGADSCDNNPNEHTSSGCTPPSSGSTGGGGGGGSSGGGGGGGGGLAATSSANEKIHFYATISSNNEIKINVNRENIAFTKTEFTVNKDLEGVTITIRSLKEDDASNTIENAYQYIEVETDGITDNDINNVKINFKVNNSWFIINNFDAESAVLNRYSGGWNKLTTKKVSESSSKVSYEATSPGFSLFAITADISKIKKIESKITKKAINETKKDETSASLITGAATADIERTNLPVGVATMIVIIVVGILVYLLFFAVKDKNKKEK